MEQHLAAGDEVSLLACGAHLAACDAKPRHSLVHCLACCGLRDSLSSMLATRPESLPLVGPSQAKKAKAIPLPTFSSLQQLLDFEWRGIKAGKGIISSLITVTNDSYPNPAEHRSLVEDQLRDYIAVYLTASDYLEARGFDKVYIFNGRYIASHAWVKACKAQGVTYVTQERVAYPDRVFLVENGGIHDSSVYPGKILEFWEANQHDPKVLAAGRDFFEERPKGKISGWHSYTSQQTPKKLPPNWDKTSRNVAIFSSSEGEFMGLQEYFAQGNFPEQRDAFIRIVRQVGERSRAVHFYLRVHPNSGIEVRRWWTEEPWSSLPNLTLIPPESDVCSYGLMLSCEKTLVWLTTMGIEATYWGKPAILLGMPSYRGIDAAYEPNDLDEAVDIILEQNLPPKPQENALAFGAFFRCGLPKLPFSEAISSTKLTFKGRQPQASEEILTCLWNWENRVSKAALPDWLKKAWQKWQWHKLHPKLKGSQIST